MRRQQLNVDFIYQFPSLTTDEWDEFLRRTGQYQEMLFAGEHSIRGVLIQAMKERVPGLLWQARACCTHKITRDVIEANLTDSEREHFLARVEEFCSKLETAGERVSLELPPMEGNGELTIRQQIFLEKRLRKMSWSIIAHMRDRALSACVPEWLDQVLAERKQ